MALLGATGRHRCTFHRRVVARGGHSLRAFSVLYRLWAAGEQSPRDIVAHLGMSRQSISVVISQLVAEGLVAREPNPQGDRRLHRVRLTEQGQAVFAQEFCAQHGLDCAWVAGLSATEQATLSALLARLAARRVAIG